MQRTEEMITIHRLLTWITTIMSSLAVAGIVSIFSTLVGMRDTLIRMEPLTNIVREHETRLDNLERNH